MNMPIKLPLPHFSRTLAELGSVTLKHLTVGDIEQVDENAQKYHDDEKHLVFFFSLAQLLFVEPELEKNTYLGYSLATKTEIANILASEMAISEEFLSITDEMSIELRLYKALELWNQKGIQRFKESLEMTERRSDEVGPLLSDAKFWISPSTPMSMFTDLIRLRESGKTSPESVIAIFVGTFERDHFYHLRDMVKGWHSNPLFTKRMAIIRDALKAHEQKKYTLSIPALLPIIEGVLTEIRGERVEGRTDKWIDEALQNLLSDFMSSSVKQPIRKYLTGYTGFKSFYGDDQQYFSAGKFPEWLAKNKYLAKDILNRHAILHGVHIDYASKENSLRAFLILDILADASKKQRSSENKPKNIEV